jgi:hypothetical protein
VLILWNAEDNSFGFLGLQVYSGKSGQRPFRSFNTAHIFPHVELGDFIAFPAADVHHIDRNLDGGVTSRLWRVDDQVVVLTEERFGYRFERE